MKRTIPTQTWIILLVLLLNIILVGPSLTPHYSSINAHDEAKYIESGRLLLRGEVRDLVWGPLVAIAYAPAHLIFGTSPDWFLLDAWGGGILLFAFIWVSFYYLGTRFSDVLSPYAMMGLLLVTPPLFDVLSNPSDALFVGLSAFALAVLLEFRRHPSDRLAALGSTLIALAVLARFEAIMLLPLFLLLVAVTVGRSNWNWTMAAAATLPACLLLAGYVGLFRISTGSSDLGIANKSYASFEMNQPLSGNGSDNLKVQRTRELFGTNEDNGGSVLRAAIRNPAAFADRIRANLMGQPDRFLEIYGKQLGPVVAILMLLGGAGFILRRRWLELTVLLLWSLQPAVSLVFLPLHFLRQLSYVPLLLAAAGASMLVSRSPQRWSRPSISLAAFGLLAFGLLDAKLAFAVAGLVSGAAVLLVEARDRNMTSHAERRSPYSAAGFLLLLAAGLILRGPYRFPDFPSIGTSEREQAVHALQETFKPGSFILEPLSLPAVAAKLNRYPLSHVPKDVNSAQDLREWMQSEAIVGIYLEGDWTERGDLSQEIHEADSAFDLIFESDSGFIHIFALK
ncbi:MAG: hypothetical protein WBR18_11770 [Anaerolineales bacterium]